MDGRRGLHTDVEQALYLIDVRLRCVVQRSLLVLLWPTHFHSAAVHFPSLPFRSRSALPPNYSIRLPPSFARFLADRKASSLTHTARATPEGRSPPLAIRILSCICDAIIYLLPFQPPTMQERQIDRSIGGLL